MAKNPVCWWEIASRNAGKTADFLSKIFEWEWEYEEGPDFYKMIVDWESNGFEGGGVFTLKKESKIQPHLTVYIEVEDIDAKAKMVEELGGEIIQGPFDITPKTRICLFNEPNGQLMAMLQYNRD